MKFFTLALFTLAFSSLIFSQRTSGQRWEDAYHLVKNQGNTIMISEFEAVDHEFDKIQVELLELDLLKKEGLIDIDFINPSKIMIYHLDFVYIEDLKKIITQYDEKIMMLPQKSIQKDKIREIIRAQEE